MSIFAKNEDSQFDSSDDKRAITSVIGKEMTVVGDISFEGKVRIDGNIEGNIQGDYLILSDTGNIIGDIDATIVVCHGQVDGNIKVKKFFLKKDGTVNGKLETTDLSVESGGVLNGEIRSLNQDLQLIQGSTQKAHEKPVLQTPPNSAPSSGPPAENKSDKTGKTVVQK